MDVETTAWTSLYHVTNAQDDKRPFSVAAFRRIRAFARPHRSRVARYLARTRG